MESSRLSDPWWPGIAASRRVNTERINLLAKGPVSVGLPSKTSQPEELYSALTPDATKEKEQEFPKHLLYWGCEAGRERGRVVLNRENSPEQQGRTLLWNRGIVKWIIANWYLHWDLTQMSASLISTACKARGCLGHAQQLVFLSTLPSFLSLSSFQPLSYPLACLTHLYSVVFWFAFLFSPSALHFSLLFLCLCFAFPFSYPKPALSRCSAPLEAPTIKVGPMWSVRDVQALALHLGT